ncbi:ABC transporter ATP-binding protein [Oceanobacillus sp. J11TS1]|uniref:ABC transporter ATP-binding protein n=1 Tax=Oceanobacillus sp. J11TS1 TaxID=2807191 RepID=UPI001B20C94F|nr:ABC transporter ATP-binding protein [Oceanobacillus sp. J11TS1]GIO23639.1 ABC transporter ATP-binding protein [Oceanobacillus sp. J11TS1]
MLVINNVTKLFGGIIANHDISFRFEKGNIVGLIGPNGAGKSTLLNMVSSVFPPSKGEILFEGERIDQLPAFRMAPLGISRTFQNLQIFKQMSVLENVMVGHHAKKKSGIFQAALRLSQSRKDEKDIYEQAIKHIKFVGLENEMELQAGNLSLGKLRLLELARALCSEPKLLLLDEIAAGLNHKETREMSDLIQKVKDIGIAVLLVEHDMDMVMKICDHIIVLDQGEKIAEGTPEEVQNNERVITAYLGEEVEETAEEAS